VKMLKFSNSFLIGKKRFKEVFRQYHHITSFYYLYIYITWNHKLWINPRNKKHCQLFSASLSPAQFKSPSFFRALFKTRVCVLTLLAKEHYFIFDLRMRLSVERYLDKFNTLSMVTPREVFSVNKGKTNPNRLSLKQKKRVRTYPP